MITYYGLFTPGCGVGYLPPMAKHMCSNRAMVQEVALVLSSLSSPVSIWKICSQDVIFAIDILFTFNVTVWTPGGYMISRRNPVESNLESADHVPTKSPQPWMDQIDPNKEVILHQESNINLAVEQQIYTAIPKSLNELWFDSHFFTVVRVVRCPLWLWQGLILPRDTGGVATWHIWHRCGVREMAWTCTEWSECDLNVIWMWSLFLIRLIFRYLQVVCVWISSPRRLWIWLVNLCGHPVGTCIGPFLVSSDVT